MPILLNFAFIAATTAIVLIGAPIWVRLSRRFGWRISQRQVYLLWALLMVVTNGRSLLRTEPRSTYFIPQFLVSIFLVGAPLDKAWRSPRQV